MEQNMSKESITKKAAAAAKKLNLDATGIIETAEAALADRDRVTAQVEAQRQRRTEAAQAAAQAETAGDHRQAGELRERLRLGDNGAKALSRVELRPAPRADELGGRLVDAATGNRSVAPLPTEVASKLAAECSRGSAGSIALAACYALASAAEAYADLERQVDKDPAEVSGIETGARHVEPAEARAAYIEGVRVFVADMAKAIEQRRTWADAEDVDEEALAAARAEVKATTDAAVAAAGELAEAKRAHREALAAREAAIGALREIG